MVSGCRYAAVYISTAYTLSIVEMEEEGNLDHTYADIGIIDNNIYIIRCLSIVI